MDEFLKRHSELLDASRYIEAEALSYEFGGPGLAAAARTAILRHQQSDAFKQALLSGKWFDAERARDRLSGADHEYTRSVMSKLLAESWSEWGAHIDSLVSATEPINRSAANAGGVGTTTSAPASSKTSEAAGQDSASPSATRSNEHFDMASLRLLKSVDAVSGIAGIRIVPAQVKQFALDFKRGASHPEAALREAAEHNPELVDSWRKTPPDKRVFIAGSRADAARIESLRIGLENDGFRVFFYTFCVQPTGELCPSATPGAFFNTAGKALLLDSEAASNSRYVAVEIGTAQRIRRGERQLILITPGQVLIVGAPATAALLFVADDSR